MNNKREVSISKAKLIELMFIYLDSCTLTLPLGRVYHLFKSLVILGTATALLFFLGNLQRYL